jgi:hypothetical protein
MVYVLSKNTANRKTAVNCLTSVATETLAMHKKQLKYSSKFTDGELLYPNGYFFKPSLLHKTGKIASDHITEVNLHTYPPSLVRNHQEVLFVMPDAKSELEIFAKDHSIPIVERTDIWELLCRPYLDTELSAEEHQQDLRLLEQNGLESHEVVSIRKRIRKTMWLNYLVWEWTYLGLFDYLSWTFLNSKKYNWAMEIALRNYRK